MANRGGSHEQHVKAGQQGHKNAGTKQASPASDTKSSSGKQGGTHKQHVKAGQQSYKYSR